MLYDSIDLKTVITPEEVFKNNVTAPVIVQMAGKYKEIPEQYMILKDGKALTDDGSFIDPDFGNAYMANKRFKSNRYPGLNAYVNSKGQYLGKDLKWSDVQTYIGYLENNNKKMLVVDGFVTTCVIEIRNILPFQDTKIWHTYSVNGENLLCDYFNHFVKFVDGRYLWLEITNEGTNFLDNFALRDTCIIYYSPSGYIKSKGSDRKIKAGYLGNLGVPMPSGIHPTSGRYVNFRERITRSIHHSCNKRTIFGSHAFHSCNSWTEHVPDLGRYFTKNGNQIGPSSDYHEFPMDFYGHIFAPDLSSIYRWSTHDFVPVDQYYDLYTMFVLSDTQARVRFSNDLFLDNISQSPCGVAHSPYFQGP